MKDRYIKNIDTEAALELEGLVSYQKGQIVSKTLAQNGSVSLTLFAFDEGEEISSHESDGDAMVIALDGEGLITIGGKEHLLEKGKTIVMPAKIPHAVHAKKPFKMLLIVVFAK
ncbi:MAG: cupin domain-containing protein [Candidatus Margulisiibacteriota bacterium]